MWYVPWCQYAQLLHLLLRKNSISGDIGWQYAWYEVSFLYQPRVWLPLGYICTPWLDFWKYCTEPSECIVEVILRTQYPSLD